MTNGQWELEELEAVLEPEEGTQRSVSCRWKHGGLGPMGELGARSGPGLSGLLRAARDTQCNGAGASSIVYSPVFVSFFNCNLG